MEAAFAHSLRDSLTGLNFNADMVQELESNAAKLGSLDAPSSAGQPTAETIRAAVAEAFVFGFRLIMLLCAGLAVASAVVAWRRIPFDSAKRTTHFGRVAAAD
jgi:hypothetical protein